MFAVTNLIGNFGTVFVDQSYWQSAIAARPSAAVKVLPPIHPSESTKNRRFASVAPSE